MRGPMTEGKELLAWPAAKVHLYTLEAAHVKNAVGRERIRRNKDALRELRCLQEILADLHAGEYGTPERRDAAEAAAASWEALTQVAAARGMTAEALCEVPRGVARFLASRRAAKQGGATLPGTCAATMVADQAASSTRTPSTATGAGREEQDARSTASDLRSDALSEAAAAVLARPASVGRMGREQLDRLAAALGEQLDQEHTALMASIEEVQGLMEAEVSGAAAPPSRAELEAFAAEVEGVLRREAAAEEQPGPVPAARAAAAAPRARRWADFSDDSEVEAPASPIAAWPAGVARPAADAAPVAGSAADGGAAAGAAAALVACARCGRLQGRASFSRRAWRRARGLGGREEPSEGAECLGCSPPGR